VEAKKFRMRLDGNVYTLKMMLGENEARLQMINQ